MADAKSKTRAEQVYKVYKHYDKYSPVVMCIVVCLVLMPY